ncbi:MAG TPA: S-layer homology domain-containing protein, partial [Fusibacter sp.]|nr:S-layer homology domain-containing protein [Fusibacter sp.]
MNTTKKNIIFVLIILSVLTLFSVNMTFAADTMDDTYGKVLADFQLITGYNGDLMEDKNITRVEMIAIISKLYASDFKSYVPPAIATFDDVKTTHWGYKYVEFAFEKGITTGKSSNTFGASDPVNYNQVSIFLIKALGYDLKGIEYNTAATEIADQYGLSLLLPTDNKALLVRGDVFELIVKALLLDDVAGVLGFEMITSNSLQKDAFISRASEIINTPVAVYVGDGFFNIYY